MPQQTLLHICTLLGEEVLPPLASHFGPHFHNHREHNVHVEVGHGGQHGALGGCGLAGGGRGLPLMRRCSCWDDRLHASDHKGYGA
eukprot:1159873-Pelagomonas_calceolata.AAC.12